MKKVLGIVLSVALVVSVALPTYQVSTSAKKESKLKAYTVSAKELKAIANSKTAKSAASKVNELSGNDYEAGVHKVLDKYYAAKDYKKISLFEKEIDSRAGKIVKNYKAADKERKNASSLKYEANTSILTFGKDISRSKIKAIVKDSYGKLDYIHKCTDGSYLVKVESMGLTAKKAADTYADYIETNSSEVNGKVKQIAEAWDMINDPYRYNEYYLSNLKVGDAWSYINNKSHSKVKVAIIDGGGIDINTNVDLTNVSNKSLSVVYNEDNSSYAMTGLNTSFSTSNMHMINGAGLIGAQSNNGSQVAGVAAGTDNSIVDLVNVAIPLTVDKIAVGLDYASSVGCKVANLSLFHEGSYDYEEAAVNRFTNNGGTVVAGAGNNGADLNGFPSDYGNVISIIATNEDNSRRGTSNYGWECDFCAPGTNITVAGPRDETWVTNGTSMASPIAAGVVAMMYSVNGGLNKTTVHNILKDTAQDLGGAGRDYEYAYGLINAGAAVAQAGGGSVVTQAPTTQAPTQAPTTTKKPSVDPNNATYEDIPNGQGLKYSTGSDATVVNVQNPGWTEGNYSGNGVYFHVPAGIESIKVNGGGGAHIEGAGGLVFLSALNDGINTIDVNYAGGSTTFYIKKEAVATTAAPTTTRENIPDGFTVATENEKVNLNAWSYYFVTGWTGAKGYYKGGNSLNDFAIKIKEQNQTAWGTQISPKVTLEANTKYNYKFVFNSTSADNIVVNEDIAEGQSNTLVNAKLNTGDNTYTGSFTTKNASEAIVISLGELANGATFTVKECSFAKEVVTTTEKQTEAPTTVAPTTTKEATQAQTTTAKETTAQQTTTAAPTTTKQVTTAEATTKASSSNVDPSITSPFGLVYAGNNDYPYYFAWGMPSGVDGFNVFVDGNYAGTVSAAAINLQADLFANGNEHIIAVQSVKGDKVSKATAIKYNKTNNSIEGTEVDDNFEIITTAKATTQKATDATTQATTEQKTTKKIVVDDVDPETLDYDTLQTNGGNDIEYSVVSGVTGLVNPTYEDQGTSLSILYYGGLNKATSITVNGSEPASGVVKTNESGVLRINPTKLTQEYSVIDVKFDNGEELIFAVKKNMSLETTKAGDQPGETTDEGGQSGETTQAVDPSNFDPEKLSYKEFTAGNSKIGYSVVQGALGLVDPVFEDGGSNLTIFYSGALGVASSVTINGVEKPDGIFKNCEAGVTRLNPAKLTEEYSVVRIKFENGDELISVIKKEAGQTATTSQGGDPSGELDPSKLEYTEIVSSDDDRYKIAYNMYQGVLGSVAPEFTGHGNSFITRFNADMKAETVTINGAKSGAVSSNEHGAIIVNPFKLPSDSYNVVVATFEDGSELIYVLRKGDPEHATTQVVTTHEQTTLDPFTGEDFFDKKVINYSEKYGRYTINVDSENSYGAEVARGTDSAYHLKIRNYGAVGNQNGVQVVSEIDGLIPGAKYSVTIPVKSDKSGAKIYCEESGGNKTLNGEMQELECILKADSDGKIYVTIGTGAVAADTSIEVFKYSVELKDTITQKQTTTVEETTKQEPTTTQNNDFDWQPTTLPSVVSKKSLTKPGKVKIKKILKKKKAAKKLTIRIKKLAGVKGYQVAIYKTKKLAKKNKKALVKKYVKKNVAKLVINSPKLKNKTKLFVRVRAYRKNDDEVKYGAWSAIKQGK